ncbi:tyrosinase, partial [Diplocarpon rosae]
TRLKFSFANKRAAGGETKSLSTLPQLPRVRTTTSRQFCIIAGLNLLATIAMILSTMLPQIIAAWTVLVALLSVDASPTASLDSISPHQRVHQIKGLHTGIKRQAGSPRPARRNILDLQKDGPAWHVFSFPHMPRRLSALQSKNESYFLSYFQIAGIHGRPYIPWGGAAQAPNASLTGYCTHSKPLNRLWAVTFRPRLFRDNPRFSLTVDRFRPLPTLAPPISSSLRGNIPTMPAVVNQPMVQITTPSGIKNVTNPTFRYVFHEFPLNQSYFPSDQSVEGDAWLSKYPYTVRGARSHGDASDPDLANSVLQSSNLKSSTWYALVKPITFNDFGTTATQGTSIEAPHNQVHGSIGMGGGHMSVLSYSAYDPIFWLHHANVDRMFALWQAINPNAYLTPQIDQYGTFSIAANSLDTASTPLEPFAAHGDSPYFTSSAVRQISTFGYTYPEIQDWNQSPAQLKANVTAAITKLYSPDGSKFTRRAGEIQSTDLLPGQQSREWSVSIRVSKFDLDGERFIVRLFLGAIPRDPGAWATSSSCVGSFPVFPPPRPATGPLPQVIAYSEVSLVQALQEMKQATNDASATTNYLQKRLNWRVQKFDGTVVPVEHIPSLAVTVQDELVTDSEDVTKLPTYGKSTAHPEATRGRAGGSSGVA